MESRGTRHGELGNGARRGRERGKESQGTKLGEPGNEAA